MRIAHVFASVNSCGTTAWGDTALGQAVSADNATEAKDFGYAYDKIGIRLKSSRDTTDVSTMVVANQERYFQAGSGSSVPGGRCKYPRIQQMV
ncbi:MAG: hypothetical protein JWL81_3153 [Verrucomicrobiales bacterium]|nr:hypothetical protein [Verrucomicrobiales bacterium]